VHDALMKRDARAPVIRLLNVTGAADRLGLIPADVDRLVETLDLHAVNVSPHGGRRFWPADIEACATAREDDRAAIASGVAVAATTEVRLAPSAPMSVAPSPVPSPELGPPRRARSQFALAPQHPRWPRFEVAQERAASSYLAFRDAEHVTAYLRARATLDLDSSHSVHTEPGRREPELAPA